MRPSIIAAKTPFNKKEILARASEITVQKNKNGLVITKDGDKIVSKYQTTDAYEVVSFGDAVKQLLNAVDKIWVLEKPEFYHMTCRSGFQELKLRGGDHVINGDVFHEMLWLTNSTNGSRRLSIRYGLMRQVCSNGACVTLAGSSFKIKHLTSLHVNDELKKFMMELPKMDVTEQVKLLKGLGKKTITVKKLVEAINPKDKKNKIVEAPVWKLLAKKFASSKTDALGKKDDAIVIGINVPIQKMTKETLDTKLSAWQVFNCYTELWRSLDSSGIERETNKILEILN
jgi:hypothetical protein